LTDVVDSGSESDNDIKEEMNSRQQLAMTIRNWSVIPENDAYILKEGAVHALIALAGVEDPFIKKCCASSLFHLSSRAENHADLLSFGAATGVITISMQVRSWKIAKLCALTLRNLSIQAKTESLMAKEGAILALVILLGIRQHRLLPVCCQALYNLTCVAEHFKGMERILKALLNLPATNFDYSSYLLKALVNCTRYSWMRLRIIEDGAISGIASILASINSRDKSIREEMVENMSICIRFLSETVSCRSDLIAKGTVDIVAQLIPHCNQISLLYCVKTIHNLVAVPTMPKWSFETSVNIISDILKKTEEPNIIQYVAACIYMFTKVNYMGIEKLIPLVINTMPKLLASQDSITQFFSIACAGNLFFVQLDENSQKGLEELVVRFVEAGPNIKDDAAIEAVALSIAKLSQENNYRALMNKLNLFDPLLDLILKLQKDRPDSMLVQECCCTALCRIALQLDDLPSFRRKQIAEVLFSLLETDDADVLKNCISSIRSLGCTTLCHEELLSNELLIRTANIITRYHSNVHLSRLCCAVLSVFSFDTKSHYGLADEKVMSVLISCTKAEDSETREYVATTLCNMSVDEGARIKMVNNGVVEVLSSLSGATSERIQGLCAKCICNLSCSIDLHKQIIDQNILQTLLMISLVRSVGHVTKLLCSRALLNLLTNNNMEALQSSGSIRIFSSLSQISCLQTQYTCARGFLCFTDSLQRREDVIQRRGAMQSLFAMVQCTAPRTRIIVGLTVCNLLACETSQRCAINAGGLSVLKIISTMEFEELKEATARVIINLCLNTSLHPCLLREPLVAILVHILHSTSGWIFECSIYALSCMSHSEIFRRTLIENDAVQALVGAVLNGKIRNDKRLAEEICRCLYFLSMDTLRAKTMIVSGQVFYGIHIIYCSKLLTPTSALLCVHIIRNLSVTSKVRQYLMDQDVLKLLINITKDFLNFEYTGAIINGVSQTIHNLCENDGLHESIIEQGFIDMLKTVILPGLDGESSITTESIQTFDSVQITKIDILHISSAIHLISKSESCRLSLVEGKIVDLVAVIISGFTSTSRYEIACSLSNLSSSKSCRELLVSQGASELIITISGAATDSEDTQKKCSLALGYLSEITQVKDGVVASLLLLNLRSEEKEKQDRERQEKLDALEKEDEEEEEEPEKINPFKIISKQIVQIKTEAADENAPPKKAPPKSLKSMIQSGLLNKKQAKKVVVEEEVKRLPTEVFSAGSDTKLKEQVINVANGQFESFKYITTILPVSQDIGGMAIKIEGLLILPFISSDRIVEPIQRSTLLIGSNVVRGPDWTEFMDDGGIGSIGIVQSVSSNEIGFNVQWQNGKHGIYRYGKIEGNDKFFKEINPIDRNSELFKIADGKDHKPKDTDTTDSFLDEVKDKDVHSEEVEVPEEGYEKKLSLLSLDNLEYVSPLASPENNTSAVPNTAGGNINGDRLCALSPGGNHSRNSPLGNYNSTMNNGANFTNDNSRQKLSNSLPGGAWNYNSGKNKGKK
jgi:hypothetical protein